MAVWGCCSPMRSLMSGKVAQLRRPAAAVSKSIRVAAPVALAARPSWVRSYAGGSLSAVWGKVPWTRLVCCLSASSAEAAPTPGSEEEHRAKHGSSNSTKWTYSDPAAKLSRALKLIPLLALANLAVPTITKLAQRAPASIGRMVSFIDQLLVLALIYSSLFVFSTILRVLTTGGYTPVPIAKLQVAVMDPQRQLQRQLERIAANAYTSGSSSPRLYILHETAKLLRNNNSSIVAGHLEAEVKDYSLAAESGFNRMLAEELGRLRVRAAHKLGLVPRKAPSGYPGSPRQGLREVTVVTLLVSGKGLQPLPQQGTKDNIGTMLEALQQVTPKSINSYQVLWAPEGGACTYSADDMAMDYPHFERFWS